jgi:hypothetical protein
MDIFTLQQLNRYKQDPTKRGADNGTQFYGKFAAVYHSFSRGDGWQSSTQWNSNFSVPAQTQGMLGNMLGAYEPNRGDAATRASTANLMGYKQQNMSRLLFLNANSDSLRTKVGIADFLASSTGTTDYTPYNGLFLAIRNTTDTDLTISLTFTNSGYTTNTYFAFGTLVPNNTDNDLVTDCTFTQYGSGTAQANHVAVNIVFPAGKTTILWDMFPWVYSYGQYTGGYYNFGTISGFENVFTYPQLMPDHEVTCAIMNKIGARVTDASSTAAFAPLWNKASEHQRIVGMY